MSSLKTKVVSSNLMKKGFSMYNNDHEMYCFIVNGKKTEIRTKISHGENEIGKPLIAKMAKQLHLSIKEFEDFAVCKISEKEYIDILKQKDVNFI